MKRFIWGSGLMALGFVIFIEAVNDGNDGNDPIIGLGFVLFILGAGLTYYGYEYKEQLKQTAEFALQMIRDGGKIDARELAQRSGISEVDIRSYIAESQRKGMIPFKVDIV